MTTTEDTVQVELSLKAPDRFFINGEWRAPSSNDTFDVINPSTEETLLTVALARDADISDAVSAAREAFDHGPWPELTHEERASYLRRLADALDTRADELAWAWSGQMGVVINIAQAMVPGKINEYRNYAALAETFPFVERHTPTTGGNVGILVREPIGVVGAIVAWNGPITLIVHKIAPALLAGCTVVVKSPPEAPVEGLVLAEMVEQIGFPPGVINVVTADREASEALVRDPRVDKITFTGSTAVGRRIATIMGERVGRTTLELGGKSAALVLDDYDIETAARSIGSLAVFLTGQACSSLTRIIVSRSRHDELVDALRAVFEEVVVGNAHSPSSGMGPVAMRRQRDRVEGYIAKGIEEGATLATGGKRPPHLDRGFFVEPTIFSNVDNHATIAREEIFGPVLSVIPANDEKHAIELANDTIYGLNNSVFTHDADRAYAVAHKLRSGTVGHNLFRCDFGITFGGYKQSGIGREGIVEGIHEFLESKTIILDEEPTNGPRL